MILLVKGKPLRGKGLNNYIKMASMKNYFINVHAPSLQSIICHYLLEYLVTSILYVRKQSCIPRMLKSISKNLGCYEIHVSVKFISPALS